MLIQFDKPNPTQPTHSKLQIAFLGRIHKFQWSKTELLLVTSFGFHFPWVQGAFFDRKERKVIKFIKSFDLFDSITNESNDGFLIY